MTGPMVLDTPGTAPPHVLSPDEFDKAQPAGANRVLSPDEFDKAQTLTSSALKVWRLPSAPPIPAAPRDVTLTPNDPRTKGKALAPFDIKDPTTYANPVLRQLVNPALENPFETAAMLGAPVAATAVSPVLGAAVAAGMGGQMVYHIAQYGWQKAAELSLPEDIRKFAEADPERISGEAAAVQAAMLGLAPLVHVGVKAARGLDYGAGMVEAGAKGVQETNLAPEASPAALQKSQTALAVSEYDARRIREEHAVIAAGHEHDALVLSGELPPPAKESLRTPRAEVYKTAAEEYAARRLAEDQADLAPPVTAEEAAVRAARAADAERIAKEAAAMPKRRQTGPAPYFESPQGAETLGAVAARHGLPNDANPYHPDSPLAEDWKTGHGAATESYPEGFSMGGALTESRIPAASEVGKLARGSDRVPGEPPMQDQPSLPGIPDGATPETVALAAALKPSRYRGHTTDALASAALDAQTAIEQAQAAVEHARTRPLTNAAAEADFENRGTNYSSEHEGSSVAAEKQLAAAKTRMAQIEREFAIRGVRGNELADIMQGAKDARAERDAMQQEDHIAFTMGEDPNTWFGDPAPAADPVAAPSASAQGPDAPVEGTGELKTRGLSASTARKALEADMQTVIGDLPQYRGMDMKAQASKVADLIASDPALARKIAMGEAPPPHGLLKEAVYVGVRRQATLDGDVATINDLATGSTINAQATEMGQMIAALRDYDPDSPVAAIQRIDEARSAGAKNAPKDIATLVSQVRKQLMAGMSPEDVTAFLNSLKC